jgi:hypothetical protein
LEWSSTGVTIRIPRSKRDQEGSGEEVEILLGTNRATCPVSALQDWMRIAPIEEWPVFRKVKKSGKVSSEALNTYGKDSCPIVTLASICFRMCRCSHKLSFNQVWNSR